MNVVFVKVFSLDVFLGKVVLCVVCPESLGSKPTNHIINGLNEIND